MENPLATIAQILKLTRPLAFIDLETTGRRPERDRIVEVAVDRLMPDGVITQHRCLINPGVLIPKAATAVHGIDDAKVAGAPRFAQLAPKLAAVLEGADLCGYGILRFDLKVLRLEFQRVNMVFEIGARRVIDTMLIYQKRQPRDLAAALRDLCGIELDGAHSAGADVGGASLVLVGIMERYLDIESSIEALHQESRDPDWIDNDGKITWQEGEPCLAFGKMEGKSLQWMAANDRGYLAWMLRDPGFAPETKEFARRALDGVFPQPK